MKKSSFLRGRVGSYFFRLDLCRSLKGGFDHLEAVRRFIDQDGFLKSPASCVEDVKFFLLAENHELFLKAFARAPIVSSHDEIQSLGTDSLGLCHFVEGFQKGLGALPGMKAVNSADLIAFEFTFRARAPADDEEGATDLRWGFDFCAFVDPVVEERRLTGVAKFSETCHWRFVCKSVEERRGDQGQWDQSSPHFTGK